MKENAFSACHPLTCFLYFLLAIAFTAVIRHPAYLAASGAAAVGYYLILRGRKGIAMLGAVAPFLLLVALANPLLNTRGQTVLFSLFGRPYTLEALCYGAVLAGMLGVMLVWFGCYSAVLTSDKFVCLFGRLIPALSLLLVMILRLIPAFQRKATQLSGARKCIGKGVGEQPAKKEKLAATMCLLSSLTDWALEGSIVTADSMRARGYGSARRSSFQLYRLKKRDAALIVCMLALAGVTVGWGGMAAEYIPRIAVEPPGLGLVAYGLMLWIPVGLTWKEELQWRISRSRI